MKIRHEQARDIIEIEHLTYSAFENHPHHPPGAKPTEHLIVNRLRDSGALTLSLIAEELAVEKLSSESETTLVGHIAFSPIQINGKESNWYGLGPVSVLPSHQGKGIGSQLIEQGINQLTALGAEGIVVLGEPEYYRRFGFAHQVALKLEGVPPEYFMAQQLIGENTIKPAIMPQGEVSYHNAFSG